MCKMYVGQTKRQIKKRIYEHKRDIKLNNKRTYLVQHFNQTDHSVLDFSFQIIDKIVSEPNNLVENLLNREDYDSSSIWYE